MEELEEIKNELLELNFNVDSVGIIYWVDAIKYVKENIANWDMIFIYDYVAEKRNSTRSKVERAIRHAIDPARENISMKYKYYNMIKNQTFLNLIQFKLI